MSLAEVLRLAARADHARPVLTEAVRLAEQKGIDVAVRALAQIREREHRHFVPVVTGHDLEKVLPGLIHVQRERPLGVGGWDRRYGEAGGHV